jgi:nitroreductase
MTLPATEDGIAWAQAWIHARRTVLPRRLEAPGPSDEQLARILEAAAAAPDHDQLLPWRFVLVPGAARGRLAAAFEQALAERDPLATAGQREQAREKAFRGPVLLLAVARLAGEAGAIPDAERLVSLGCAVQNLLLMATALGFGSALTSGKAMGSRPLRELFALAPHEQAVCFVSVGTVAAAKPGKPRPRVEDYVTTLGATPCHPGQRHDDTVP